MAKASPMVRAFNAGEFSDLLAGRVDLDRYPASLREMLNVIAAPQGPAISRSGTAFTVPTVRPGEYSALVPFVFSNEQAKILEFASDRIRFINEDGIQVYGTVAATVTSAAGAPIVFTSATINASVNDQVVLSGFPDAYNLNGEIAFVTAKSGSSYTLDVTYPAGKPVVNGEASRIYHVPHTITETQRKALRFVQSVDVLYLLTGARPKKLSRYADYDWRLVDVEFGDGPFMPTNEDVTTLTPVTTGNSVKDLTADSDSGYTASASSNRAAISASYSSPVDFLGRQITYNLPVSNAYLAFDADDTTYWAAGTAQKGVLTIMLPAAKVVDGYTIYAAKDNQDYSYTSKDYAPSSFTFEGFDGTSWIVLDTQIDYVLYDSSKSVFIEIQNSVAYSGYRLSIQTTTRNGSIEPRVRRLVMRTTDSRSITINASGTKNINRDQGFLSTDVGRLIRLKGTDGAWRALRIDAVNSTTQIVAYLLAEPFVNLQPINDWRLSYWSDTTGWPTVGEFFEDRLWLAGPAEYPDMFAGSTTGGYEVFSQTDSFGEVLDDSAIVGRLNSRKLSGIRWLSSDSRGLTLGTGSEEYSINAPNNESLTAKNAKARPSTRRGSAAVEPARVDSQVLYVQRSGRTVREYAYVYEADGYKSPSMSQLASHLGAVKFVEMDYAAEPHAIIWIRRADGSIVGLTYNRDENVIGWHRHDFGGEVEAIAVIPQKDQLQDALWMVIKRTINGQTRRYIERLTRFWDFDTTLEDAHFVDCGLRYSGDAVDTIYGLQHLEGEEVYGLTSGGVVGPLTVVNGSVELPYAVTWAVIGLGYDSVAETSQLENGAADGTAQGKVKRINSLVLNLWSSYGGEVGVYNSETKGPVYEPLDYPGRFDEFEDLSLYTGMVGPITPEAGYEMRGSVFIRRPKSSPLPFNILSIMPQLNTQDR